ncbi:hypothetical protein [Actinoallomurus rhizosphaericola]|uniref:hypothetical protein n=1 Tax=Actinoallomurus rhizosphaericola TaxID=2952536 RepID=UPI0038735FC0
MDRLRDEHGRPARAVRLRRTAWPDHRPARPALGTGTWHRLALRFQGTAVGALIDGKEVAAVTDATYGHGQSGVALDSYINAQFDRFAVTAQ